MSKKKMVLASLVVAAGTAWADKLSLPVQKHTVTCASLAACPIRKPEGIGGWEILGRDVVLEEKGGGLWLADFSKVKGATDAGRATLQLLTPDGRIVQVDVKAGKR